jgi:glycosyltransferase involved in cell wall biosynthesis
METRPSSRSGAALLSVVVPCFNDADVLAQTHRRLLDVLGSREGIELEVIYVDDGSSDGTPGVLNSIADADQRVVVLTLARNFGHQAAVTAGLQYAGGDAVAVMDSDLQDPPELIPEMIGRWRDGYDVIYGVRAEREAGLAKRVAYKSFYRLMRTMATIDIPLDSGDFSLMDRKAVDALNALPERNRFVRGLRSWIGLRQIGIPYQRPARAAGASGYTTFKLVGLALDGIMSMSAKPLSFIFVLGAVSSIVSILGFVFYFVWWSLGIEILGRTPGDAPGFTSVVLLLFLLSGIQLISLGIIGGYVGRIYDEAKNRPIFVLDRVRGCPRRRREAP